MQSNAYFKCLALWVAVSVAPAVAQTPPPPAPPPPPGATCNPPEFSFIWIGSGEPALVAKADPPGKFKVCILPIASSSDGDISHPPGCRNDLSMYDPVDADADGEINDVDLGRFSLIGADGYVVVEYESEETGDCEVRRKGTTPPITAIGRHQLVIDVGTVSSLQDDGSFTTGPELAVGVESNFTRWVGGFLDLRFSGIGDIDEADEDEEGDEQDEGDEEMEEAIFNPFDTGGNTIRANFGIAYYPVQGRGCWKDPGPPPCENGKDKKISRTFAVIAGGGFTTVPEEEGDDQVRAEIRYFAGIQFRVLRFNSEKSVDQFKNTYGYGRLTFARDDFWQWEEVRMNDDGTMDVVPREEKDRIVFEWQLEIPNVNIMGARFAVRLFADVPLSGDGPSDVRASLLASVNLSQFLPVIP